MRGTPGLRRRVYYRGLGSQEEIRYPILLRDGVSNTPDLCHTNFYESYARNNNRITSHGDTFF